MKHSLNFNTIKRQLFAAAAAVTMAVPLMAIPSHASAQELDTAGADSSVAASIRSCGPVPANKDHSRWGRYFKGNGVNIRRSPSTSSRICAQGQKSHVVDYYCWTFGNDGHTWTFLRDVTTNYAGWVRDDLLKNDGSFVHC